MDRRARRAAKQVGLLARKTRWGRGSSGNRGDFQLLNSLTNSIVVGERFQLTAEEVIAACERQAGA